MPTKPTTNPYQWATNPGTQELPSTGLQEAGFADGMPVPDKIHNHMFGTLFAWLVFLWGGLLGGITGELVFLPSVSAPWHPGPADTTTTISAINPDGVTITNNGGDNVAAAYWAHLIASGTIGNVDIDIGALTTTTGNASVSITISGYNGGPGVPVTATYAANISSTGVTTVPQTAGTAPTEGPLTVRCQITTGSTSGDLVRVDSLTINL